jgi:hypothetical protein
MTVSPGSGTQSAGDAPFLISAIESSVPVQEAEQGLESRLKRVHEQHCMQLTQDGAIGPATEGDSPPLASSSRSCRRAIKGTITTVTSARGSRVAIT